MAQLKDDCFAFGEGLIPLESAMARIDGALAPAAGVETAALADALGRFAARDITAPRAVPPHDNSAVDGCAVYFDDLSADGETRMPVGGRAAAGHPLGRPAARGEAVRVFTGAPMPAGADGTQGSGPDTVFMEEDTRDAADEKGAAVVVLPPGLKRGANRRFKGEDIEKGRVIIKAGRRLRPQDIGLAASVGLTELPVYAPLRAAVFSTGDEVFNPGEPAPEGGIYDSNRFTVRALLNALGLRVTDLGVLPDKEDAIAEALAAAAPSHDLIITSGGVSAGEEDHVKAAVERLGRIDFWRLAIKPGRPVAMGRISAGAGGDAGGGASGGGGGDGGGDDVVFIGLPGNPVAAMVTFAMIARPVILALQGANAGERTVRRFRVPAAFDAKKKPGRREWLRARLAPGPDGVLAAHKFSSSGAGVLTSIAESDGLAELGEDVTAVKAGAMIDFVPFNEVFG
ncbi:MAG: molybdopterin molybdotransferase MoeA [Rhodospirillales bacterium]